jgi:hypothetical protein
MAPQWAFAWEVVHRTALDAVAVQRVVRRNVQTAGGQVLTVREQRSKREHENCCEHSRTVSILCPPALNRI